MNNTIPAVDKAVLMLLALSNGAKTQAELSKELGVATSTAYRILMTLQAHRWVRKQQGGIYTLGEGVLGLTHGLSLETAILEEAGRKVADISRRHQIACKLSVRQGDRQLTCCRAEPSGPVALTGQIGSTFPLIEGSVGAALLAETSADEIDALVQACQEDIPEKRHPELVHEAVREARERGTVLNMKKNRWNIVALSIPLRNRSGQVIAALTLLGSSEDFSGGRREKWEKILKRSIIECEQS